MLALGFVIEDTREGPKVCLPSRSLVTNTTIIGCYLLSVIRYLPTGSCELDN